MRADPTADHAGFKFGYPDILSCQDARQSATIGESQAGLGLDLEDLLFNPSSTTFLHLTFTGHVTSLYNGMMGPDLFILTSIK